MNADPGTQQLDTGVLLKRQGVSEPQECNAPEEGMLHDIL